MFSIEEEEREKGGKVSRFWNNHVELLHDQTVKFLPPPWKEMVENDELELDDVPEEIRLEATNKGIEDYEASKIDAARDRLKYGGL